MEDSLIDWLLVIICSSHCIKNPYLIAKIVEVVFIMNPLVQSPTSTALLYDRFMTHQISQTILPSALMKFYTDVETTGSSSEFYDKFTIRYHISLIFKGALTNCVRILFNVRVFQVCGVIQSTDRQ